jgi:HSP20 family protein
MWFDQWSPFFDMDKTLAEVDRMLSNVGRPLELRSVPRGTFPAINIYDQGQATVLMAEIPGVKADDLDVMVLGDTVTLKGRRNSEPANGNRYYRKERGSGDFTRTITLPDAVNPDTVNAEYKDGVLAVRMEKAEETKPKKVEIKT